MQLSSATSVTVDLLLGVGIIVTCICLHLGKQCWEAAGLGSFE